MVFPGTRAHSPAFQSFTTGWASPAGVSGREGDVRVGGRRVPPGVYGAPPVELPLRRRLPPGDLRRRALGDLLGDHVVVRPEVVTEEVIVPLGARHQGVPGPG